MTLIISILGGLAVTALVIAGLVIAAGCASADEAMDEVRKLRGGNRQDAELEKEIEKWRNGR